MKKGKRVLVILFTLVVTFTMLCPSSVIAASKIKLNKTKATLYVGNTITLNVTGTTKKATWTSSKKSVATVSSSGKVTAKKQGTAKITAKVGSKTYSCTVTVKSPAMSKKTVTLYPKKTTTLKVYGVKGKITWTSSKKSVATVSSKGKVTAKKKGTTVISAKVGKKKFTCKVTVKNPAMSKSKATLYVGKTLTLKVNGSIGTVKWSSSKKSVATVSSKGKVTAKKKGTATITAKNGTKKYTCKITVKTPYISKTKVTLGVGATTTLKFYGSRGTVKWSSSKTSVATVNAKGKVTAKGPGTATISAKDSKRTLKCTVTVTQSTQTTQPAQATLSTTSIKLIVGEELPLTLSGATIQSKTSSNSEIAAITASGSVKAVKAGTCQIIVTDTNNQNYTCTVTVEEPVLSKNNIIIYTGNQFALNFGGNSQAVSWTSSDTNIATVDGNGQITAVNAGQVKITAKISTKTYECLVTIEPSLDGVSISKQEAELQKGGNLTLALSGTSEVPVWESNNNDVATVDASGKVTAGGAGIATIYAKIDAYAWTCMVKVYTPADPADTGVTFTRGEWIHQLVTKLGIDLDVDEASLNYYYADTKGSTYGIEIEVARLQGILPMDEDEQDVPVFQAEEPATREFAAVTAVNAMGFVVNKQEVLSCSDQSSLKYPSEDAIAISQAFLSLMDGSFRPNDAVTKADQTQIFAAFNAMDTSGDSNSIPTQENIAYNNDVIIEQIANISYTLTQNADGSFTVVVPKNGNTLLITAGKAFVLPKNNEHSTSIALKAVTVEETADGMLRVLAQQPGELAEIVSSIEFQGQATVVPEQIESLQEGVTVQYNPHGTIGDEFNTNRMGAKSSISGSLSDIKVVDINFGDGLKLNNNTKVTGKCSVAIPDITAKLDANLSLLSGIKVNEFKLSVTSKAEASAQLVYSTSSESSPGVSGSKQLGKISMGLGSTGFFCDVIVSLYYDAEGKISFVYTFQDIRSVEYSNGNIRFPNRSTTRLDLGNIEVDAQIGLQLDVNLTFLEVWDLIGVEVKIGPKIHVNVENHVADTLYCLDVKGHVAGIVGLNSDTLIAEIITKIHGSNIEKVFWDQQTSGLKFHYHFENGSKVRECTYGQGSIQGYVFKDDSTTPIQNARVKVTKGVALYETMYTDASGAYTVEELSPGEYTLVVSATGYQTFTDHITVAGNTPTYVETLLMVDRNQPEGTTGNVQGKFIDAVTGTEMAGVTYVLRSGWNNTSGDAVLQNTSDYNYSFDVAPGNYTLAAAKDGYITNSINVAVSANVCKNIDVVLSPEGGVSVEGSNLRIVLTWGAEPSDLDSYLFGVKSDDSSFYLKTCYYDKDYYYNDTHYANLDVDDTTSYGPETTTIYSVGNTDRYSFYIHDYTNRGSSYSAAMGLSSAKVTVYSGTSIIAVFNVPSGMEGTIWHVFDYDGATDTLRPVNTMYYGSEPSGVAANSLNTMSKEEQKAIEEISKAPEK